MCTNDLMIDLIVCEPSTTAHKSALVLCTGILSTAKLTEQCNKLTVDNLWGKRLSAILSHVDLSLSNQTRTAITRVGRQFTIIRTNRHKHSIVFVLFHTDYTYMYVWCILRKTWTGEVCPLTAKISVSWQWIYERSRIYPINTTDSASKLW